MKKANSFSGTYKSKKAQLCMATILHYIFTVFFTLVNTFRKVCEIGHYTALMKFATFFPEQFKQIRGLLLTHVR